MPRPTDLTIVGDPAVAQEAMAEVIHIANKATILFEQSGLESMEHSGRLQNGGEVHVVETEFARYVLVNVRGVPAEGQPQPEPGVEVARRFAQGITVYRGATSVVFPSLTKNPWVGVLAPSALGGRNAGAFLDTFGGRAADANEHSSNAYEIGGFPPFIDPRTQAAVEAIGGVVRYGGAAIGYFGGVFDSTGVGVYGGQVYLVLRAGTEARVYRTPLRRCPFWDLSEMELVGSVDLPEASLWRTAAWHPTQRKVLVWGQSSANRTFIWSGGSQPYTVVQDHVYELAVGDEGVSQVSYRSYDEVATTHYFVIQEGNVVTTNWSQTNTVSGSEFVVSNVTESEPSGYEWDWAVTGAGNTSTLTGSRSRHKWMDAYAQISGTYVVHAGYTASGALCILGAQDSVTHSGYDATATATWSGSAFAAYGGNPSMGTATMSYTATHTTTDYLETRSTAVSALEGPAFAKTVYAHTEEHLGGVLTRSTETIGLGGEPLDFLVENRHVSTLTREALVAHIDQFVGVAADASMSIPAEVWRNFSGRVVMATDAVSIPFGSYTQTTGTTSEGKCRGVVLASATSSTPFTEPDTDPYEVSGSGEISEAVSVDQGHDAGLVVPGNSTTSGSSETLSGGGTTGTSGDVLKSTTFRRASFDTSFITGGYAMYALFDRRADGGIVKVDNKLYAMRGTTPTDFTASVGATSRPGYLI